MGIIVFLLIVPLWGILSFLALRWSQYWDNHDAPRPIKQKYLMILRLVGLIVATVLSFSSGDLIMTGQEGVPTAETLFAFIRAVFAVLLIPFTTGGVFLALNYFCKRLRKLYLSLMLNQLGVGSLLAVPMLPISLIVLNYL
jgi:hypothetical protein